jgi:hypothetical protein
LKNVFHGMRRAKKEGRVMGLAPLGYINKISEAGKKTYCNKRGSGQHHEMGVSGNSKREVEYRTNLEIGK